jgi:hypothetical protein
VLGHTNFFLHGCGSSWIKLTEKQYIAHITKWDTVSSLLAGWNFFSYWRPWSSYIFVPKLKPLFGSRFTWTTCTTRSSHTLPAAVTQFPGNIFYTTLYLAKQCTCSKGCKMSGSDRVSLSHGQRDVAYYERSRQRVVESPRVRSMDSPAGRRQVGEKRPGNDVTSEASTYHEWLDPLAWLVLGLLSDPRKYENFCLWSSLICLVGSRVKLHVSQSSLSS